MIRVLPRSAIVTAYDYAKRLCVNCGGGCVRFGKNWACPDCHTILQQALPGWDPEPVPLRVLFPNRASRRRQVR